MDRQRFIDCKADDSPKIKILEVDISGFNTFRLMYPLEKMTLKHLLERSVKLYNTRPALSMVDGQPITYEQLGHQVQTLSGVLYNQGITPGDRVAILSENKPTWGIAFFAITTMGAVAVPILPDFHSNSVQHILRHSGAKAIFISKKQYHKIEDARIESLNTIFLIDDFSVISSETRASKLKEVIKEGQKEYMRLKEAALKIIGRVRSEVQENDIASIIYTSGTTGHSKGVILTHKNFVFDATATLKIQTVTSEDRLLSILPLSHSYECTIGFLIPLMQGACIYYIDKTPVARVLLPAMEKIKPTMMLTVPLIMEKIYKTRILPQFTQNGVMRKMYKIPILRKRLHRIAAMKVYKMFGGKLRFFGIGGALLDPNVELFLREGKFPYAIGYGLTETSPLIAGSSPKATKYRSTGPAIPGVEIRINQPNPVTGEGEIWVRGENVMKGYYNDPERTKEVLLPDGWFRTGDLGLLDKDGYLYIKGRLKNMIVGPNGENIYPEEIESVINECDYVLESLVYQDNGQLIARVHLNYELLDEEFKSSKLSETQIAQRIREKLEEVRNFVNSRVPAFSRIKKVIEQPEPFEKTPTQKIKRYLYVT